KNVSRNFLEIELIHRSDELAPGFKRSAARQRHQSRLLIAFREKDWLVISCSQDGFSKTFAQVVECLLWRVGASRQLEFIQPVSCPHRLIKQNAVAEHVTHAARRAVNDFAPRF